MTSYEAEMLALERKWVNLLWSWLNFKESFYLLIHQFIRPCILHRSRDEAMSMLYLIPATEMTKASLLPLSNPQAGSRACWEQGTPAVTVPLAGELSANIHICIHKSLPLKASPVPDAILTDCRISSTQSQEPWSCPQEVRARCT